MSPWFSDALLRTQTDERLVALARDGHERAFVAIVERYRRPLHAFTRRLVPEARAEDVLQQAFLNAWAALGRGAEVRHLRGWLHQIVRHAALAAVRAPGEDPLPDTMIDTHDTLSQVEERLLVQQTLANLAALPETQREAIVKTAMEGLSREDVASSMGVTEGAVRAMLNRARTTLRAAATAITPFPVAVWAAGATGMSVAERTADVAAGTSAAGLAAAAAKAGTVVAVTGAVATTVVGDRLPLVHHRTPTQAPTAQSRENDRTAMARPAATAAPVPASALMAAAQPAQAQSQPVRTAPVLRRTTLKRSTALSTHRTFAPVKSPASGDARHGSSDHTHVGRTKSDETDSSDGQTQAVVANADEQDAQARNKSDSHRGDGSGDGSSTDRTAPPPPPSPDTTTTDTHGD